MRLVGFEPEDRNVTDLHSDSSDGCFRQGLICRAHAMAFHFSASQVRTSESKQGDRCRRLRNAFNTRHSIKTGMHDVLHPDIPVTFVEDSATQQASDLAGVGDRQENNDERGYGSKLSKSESVLLTEREKKKKRKKSNPHFFTESCTQP